MLLSAAGVSQSLDEQTGTERPDEIRFTVGAFVVRRLTKLR